LSLLKELKRRNVFKVSIAYLVLGWLVLQVADVVLDNITAPGWIFKVLMLFLAIGLPFVVFFAWAFELTPEGLKRESEVDRTQSITPKTGKRLDFLIFAVMALALGYFAVDKFVLSSGRDAALVESTTQAITAHTEEAIDADNSIAVLPFVNMSSDKEQEYFSDGLSEELLNLLARVPGLRVIARTSSFAYKGKDVQIAEVARELNVRHVLEGSVRKSGNQLRITAQLIDARDSSHLWSETYDRNLDNIFAIQDEIATRIAAALLPQLVTGADGAPAGIEHAENSFMPPVDVYQRYLLARNQFNSQTGVGRTKALDAMTELVGEYPDYAEAQAFYALVVFASSARTGGDIPWVEAEAISRSAISKALALKPDLAEAYLVEGSLSQRSYALDSAMASFEKAIERNPSYSDAYVALAQLAMRTGQQDRGWQALERAKALDPVSPLMLRTVASLATGYDRPAMAQEAMALLNQIAPESASRHQVSLYWMRDEIARAAVQLENHRKRFPDAGENDDFLALLYDVLGMRDEASKLSAGSRLRIAARDGKKDLALKLMEELAAERTDPHDRADIQWFTYYSLGMYDMALSVLSDLWYGYAEQTMGPRMDTFDCTTFAHLLIHAGRGEEAQPVIGQLKAVEGFESRWWIRGFYDAHYLLFEGKVDEAFLLLDGLADKGQFLVRSEQRYLNFFGLEKHPDYPALIAKYEEWRKGQVALYQSLKASEPSQNER